MKQKVRQTQNILGQPKFAKHQLVFSNLDCGFRKIIKVSQFRSTTPKIQELTMAVEEKGDFRCLVLAVTSVSKGSCLQWAVTVPAERFVN